MEFANSIFLWGLLAVPLPILLHLFFRRHKRKVDFSTLQFFNLRRRFLAHRRRLRELLLLLLRTLAILLLVMALARLVLRKIAYATNHGTDIVLIIDDTLSMQRTLSTGNTAYDLVRRKAEEILNTLNSGDSAAVVFLSQRQGISLTPKRQYALELLQRSPVTATTGSYSAAIKSAEILLHRSTNPNREIYIISDLQKNQLPDNPLTLKQTEKYRLFLLPIKSNDDNISIHIKPFSTRPKMVNRPIIINCEVRNHADRETSTELSLTLDGNIIERRQITIPSNGNQQEQFTIIPNIAGFHQGKISLIDSSLELDNNAFFACNVAENIKVLLLKSDVLSRADPYFFLKNALAPNGEICNGIELDTLFMQSLVPAQLKDYHIIAIANSAKLDKQTADTLEHFMKNGGTVISFAGSKMDHDTFTTLSIENIKTLYQNKFIYKGKGLTFSNSLNALNDLLEMDSLQWRRLHTLKIANSATTTILAKCGKYPVIVENRFHDGRWISIACSARRDYSNWPELISFPITMIHLFTHAAHSQNSCPTIQCGQQLKITPDAKKVKFELPNGKIKTFDNAKSFTFTDTRQNGILKIDGANIQAAILNTPEKESMLKVASANSAANRLVNNKCHILRTDADLASQISNFRQGSDLSGILLLLVIIILVCESMLGNDYFKSRKINPTKGEKS